MDLEQAIHSYMDENWEQIVNDIDMLVRIPSVEDLDAASSGAPYGPEPARALQAVLGIADRMGLATCNCGGYIGFADLPGTTETQVGIIGHVDVVPAGPGWSFPAYEVTRKEGYLVGRGVADDKGPLVVALHAVNFWKKLLDEQDRQLPYTLRVLFGANEETGMGDVPYYRARYSDPAFLFTPDAEFPVGYGEAGICHGVITSGLIRGGRVQWFEGGVAANAVPGEASARFAWDGCALPEADAIEIEPGDGSVTVRAYGKSAHASTPELGENAIGNLVRYAIDADLLSAEERAFFELAWKVTSCFDGLGVGLQCSDEHFGDLTAVGSMMEVRDDGERRFALTVDVRYPTTTSASVLEHTVNGIASSYGATFEITGDKSPYLMDPDSPAIKALIDAYRQVTGEDAQPFAMKGGTYAREFSHAASFGPEKPWEVKPSWAGAMHAADEAIDEGLLKQTFAVYVRAIERLMETDIAQK